MGAGGGVGRSVLSLLGRHPATATLRNSLASLSLVDASGRFGSTYGLPCERRITTELGSTRELAELIRVSQATEVIDLAGLHTLECAQACDLMSVSFLTTSFDHWPQDPSPPRLDEVRALLPGQRRPLERASHLVGSGMNPGLINALVSRAISALAERCAASRAEVEAELGAIVFTERDTSQARPQDLSLPPGAFPMTWSPADCLQELVDLNSAWVSNATLKTLATAPYRTCYRARCGATEAMGYLVPHEELVTLGHRYPRLDLAFIYELPRCAREALAALASDPERQLHRVKLYPPEFSGELQGSDSVGVLLCSHRHGELWTGFETDNRLARGFETNATELQVAAGVLSGWQQLGCCRGLHTPEELDPERYLDAAETILGSCAVYHDPSQPFTPLVERCASGHAAGTPPSSSR